MNFADRFAKQTFKKFPKVDGRNSVKFLRYLVEETPHDVPRLEGKGVVICGGGFKYLPPIYASVCLLRHFGIKYPIQIWHLGPEEIVGNIKKVFSPLNVTWINALTVTKKHPVRLPLKGWPLKTYALLHCGFRDVIFLDADCMVARNPGFLFQTTQYKGSGLLLWNDPMVWLDDDYWQILTGLESVKTLFPEPVTTKTGFLEIESGEMVIDLEKCYRLFLVQRMINEYSDFYFKYFRGDKATLQIALGLLKQKCTIVDEYNFYPADGVSYKWLDKKVIFEHWTATKVPFNSFPLKTPFLNSELYKRFLRHLVDKWELGGVAELIAPLRRPPSF
jgi:hypothetical protein